MKSKNLIVVFSSEVDLAGNSNAPKIVSPSPIFLPGSSFCIKNKVKSEIIQDKKSLWTKIFLSVWTKNLYWESLTKNLVTCDLIMGFHWKIWFCFFWGEGLHELKVWGGEVGQFSDLRGQGSLLKRERVFSPSHFGRQSACDDITKQLTPKQI